MSGLEEYFQIQLVNYGVSTSTIFIYLTYLLFQALVAKQLNTYKGCCSIQGAMIGDYKIVDSVLVCVLHMVKDKKKPQPLRSKKKRQKDVMMYHVPEQHFHVEFIIEDSW